MKLLCITFLFYFVLMDSTYSQGIEVVYKCENKVKLNKLLEKRPENYNPSGKELADYQLVLSIKDLWDNYSIDFKLKHYGKESSFSLVTASNSVLTEETDIGTKRYYFESKDNVVYKNFNSGSILGEYHKHSRVFHINDSVPELCWSITKRQKYVLGYLCTEAVLEDYHGFKITAWFTAQLPIPNGPMEFGALPGLILELTNEVWLFTATDIDVVNRDDTAIERLKPNKKGINLTEYYAAIRSVKSFGSD